MPLHTIALIEFGVTHIQSGTAVHPSHFGPQALDLLDLTDRYLKSIQGAGSVALGERFLTVESTAMDAPSREIRSEFDYGHFGSRRRVRDSTSGALTGSVGVDEVAADGLRLAMSVPTSGLYASAACELAGRGSFVGLWSPHFKQWFQKETKGYVLSIDYVEDPEAWREYLDGALLKELTFIARKPADGNRAGHPTTEIYEVRPGRGQALPRRWLDRLLSDGRLPASEALSHPVPDDEIDEVKVAVERDGRRRTITIGGDWPRFTWEIVPGSSSRPSDSTFLSVARDLMGHRLEVHASN